jgi:hypothetical protein
MIVWSSEVKVWQGAGGIDVGGLRRMLIASTDAGGLHVKPVPYDNW